VARLYADRLTSSLGQQIMVEETQARRLGGG